MLIKESNLTINVSDLNKSIDFYKSIGFSEKTRWGDHYAQMVASGIVIGLHPVKTSQLKGNSGNVSIGFTANDFEAAKKQLSGLNIDVRIREEEGGQFIHFNDPDGNSLYFIKPNW